MYILYSPTKTMQSLSAEELASRAWPEKNSYAPPAFPQITGSLYESLEDLSPDERADIWGIKGKLLEKTEEDFIRFAGPQLQTPALFAYNGLQYKYLDAKSLAPCALEHLEKSLCILSGFYGCLNAATPIRPYRLEMKTRWSPDPACRTLGDYWRPHLERHFSSLEGDILNLASDEYSAALPRELLEHPRMTHVHIGAITENKKGEKKFRAQATLAKMGRGLLLRYIAMAELREPGELKGYTGELLRFDPELSSENHLYFVRKED